MTQDPINETATWSLDDRARARQGAQHSDQTLKGLSRALCHQMEGNCGLTREELQSGKPIIFIA